MRTPAGETPPTMPDYKKLRRALDLLERVDFPEGGEDWSLLANATTALEMILERRAV